MKKCLNYAFLLSFLTGSNHAMAEGGAAVQIIDYYHLILSHFFGLDEHAAADWGATVAGLFSLLLILIMGLVYKRSVERDFERALVPDSRFSVRAVVEVILEFVYGLGESLIGAKEAPTFFPLLAGIFVFIFVSNLSGLVPGFTPTTDSINTNLAMGLMVFVIYNIAGIKEHGAHYIKQFVGPVLLLAPLMLIIEVIGHIARPISLSLRLYGNIFGDHLVLSVFTGLTVLIFPAALLFFGLLVASLQSFVFTLLSGIYISMAISHDH